MRTLNEQLSSYAAYHRDRRNIATHFVGVPMIVFGVFAFMARPSMAVGGFPLSPAVLVLVLGGAFYLALDVRFGLAMLGVTIPAFAFGTWLAMQSTGQWLGGAAGLFGVLVRAAERGPRGHRSQGGPDSRRQAGRQARVTAKPA
jgi:uncharacterized membrane protein YGL010W